MEETAITAELNTKTLIKEHAFENVGGYNGTILFNLSVCVLPVAV